MLKLVSRLAAFALLIASPALAGPLEDGMNAIRQSDFAAARVAFEKGVAAGDPEAHYHLGVMSSRGEGMAANPVRALELYRFAANKGYALALHNLGDAYRTGKGVPVDLAEARKHFLQSARLGHGQSMYNYATMLLLGEGGPVDTAGALDWYELAEDHEVRGVGILIEHWVREGKLPKPDYKKRLKAQLAAANAGDAEAQYRLGMMYFRGRGAKPDYKEMQRWFLAAANQGHPIAQLRMGNMYKDGYFQTRDLPRANEWFRKAAMQNNGFALSILGVGHMGGLGVPQDEVKGYALLVLGAWFGDYSAKSIRHGAIGTRVSEEVVVKGKALAMTCLAEGMVRCGI
jgi:uncharacterized protein